MIQEICRCSFETCRLCGMKTGRAGECEDSLYLEDGFGPLCEDCKDRLTEPRLVKLQAKQLEWEEHIDGYNGGKIGKIVYIAHWLYPLISNDYYIFTTFTGFFISVIDCNGRGVKIPELEEFYPDVETAKEVCQLHFNKMIMSCLDLEYSKSYLVCNIPYIPSED